MIDNNIDELKRLKFEDLLWIVFGILCFMNVYGDRLQEKDISEHSKVREKQANEVFTFTLIVTFLIYIYFFLRNYNNYNNAKEKEKDLYRVKVMGSGFLIAGIVCLIYFQIQNKNFIGAPSL